MIKITLLCDQNYHLCQMSSHFKCYKNNSEFVIQCYKVTLVDDLSNILCYEVTISDQMTTCQSTFKHQVIKKNNFIICSILWSKIKNAELREISKFRFPSNCFPPFFDRRSNVQNCMKYQNFHFHSSSFFSFIDRRSNLLNRKKYKNFILCWVCVTK